jgi:hypothetical protein
MQGGKRQRWNITNSKAECDSCNSGMGSIGRIKLNLEITWHKEHAYPTLQLIFEFLPCQNGYQLVSDMFSVCESKV